MPPVEQSPFFRPSSNHRVIVVQERTPGGKHVRTVQKPDENYEEHKSTLLGTASNLVNAIVGCGIVGIPYAISKAGFLAGIFLVIFVAIATEKSLRLLVFTAKHIHVPSYETLAEACFGVVGFRFIAINMFIIAYGAMTSYLVLVKDSFGSLFLGTSMGKDDLDDDSNVVVMRRMILLVISMAIVLPISCKRDMADLAFTSRLNVVIDTTLVALVAYNAPIRAAAEHAKDFGGDNNIWLNLDTVFVGLGVLSFAFVCQHSAFIIAGSLKNPTAKRWGQVSGGALTVCCILALFCGIMGYLGYHDGTRGNILDNLDEDSLTANIARAMLGTTMLFVYPLESFVARHVCVVMMFSGRAAHEGDDHQILARRDRRVILTTAIYISTIIPAALAKDLGPILAVTGAIGGSCLSYFGPGAVFLGVHGERFLELVNETWGSTSSGGDTSGFSKDAIVDTSKAEDGMVVVSPGTPSSPPLAVETTPLVSGQRQTLSHSDQADKQQSRQGDEGNDTIVVEGIAKRILFYLLGMPIWCAIARHGKNRLKEHIHNMALKSPHPIRIGDVEYKRMVVNMTGHQQADSAFQELVRANSQKLSAAISSSERGGTVNQMSSSERGLNINQLIGQGILEQQQQQQKNQQSKKLSAKQVEVDPQEDPPSWLDFYIAVCYMLLGAVALFAGLYSLYLE